jgi:hypothetical protein
MSRALVPILLLLILVTINSARAAPAPDDQLQPLDEFVRVRVIEDQLRIQWLPPIQPPRGAMSLRGPEARWELRSPAPIRGVPPMTLELQRPPAGTRDRESFWYISITSAPEQQLSILAYRGGRGAAAASTLRFQQALDGAVHLVVLDNVNRTFAQAGAKNIVALRAQHPQLVRMFLVPLLRQISGDDPLLPGPADVYRVFDEFSPDPQIERRVRELLPKLADHDYRIREAATQRLAQLGPQAICAIVKLNFDELTPEQRWRIEQLLARASRRSIDDPEPKRSDLGFLADCLEFDDVRVRRAAKAQIEQMTGEPIPLHPSPTPAEWTRAADVVRERLARAARK